MPNPCDALEEAQNPTGTLVVGRSFYQEFRRDVIFLIILIMALNALWHVIPFFTDWTQDASDPPKGRSGMSVKTDAMTGCQYLEGPQGLFPRLRSNGSQVCGGDNGL